MIGITAIIMRPLQLVACTGIGLSGSRRAWINGLAPKVRLCHGADTPSWQYSRFLAGFTDEDKKVALQWLEPSGTSLLGEPSLGGPKTEDKVKEVDEIKVVKDES